MDYHIPSHVRLSDDCKDLLKKVPGGGVRALVGVLRYVRAPACVYVWVLVSVAVCARSRVCSMPSSLLTPFPLLLCQVVVRACACACARCACVHGAFQVVEALITLCPILTHTRPLPVFPCPARS